MLNYIKKLIPTSLKKSLKTVKLKILDAPRKRRLYTAMRLKHSQLVESIKHKKKIKVVFLAIHKSVWKVDPVFQKMLAEPSFEPLILVCPYTAFGLERMKQDMHEAISYFEGKGYPLISSYSENEQRWLELHEINPDIVFFTNPHNLTRKEYYEDAYINYLTCYVPYYFMATNHVGPLKQLYSSDFLISQWKIFWPHKVSYDESLKNSVVGGDNGYVIGYPGVEKVIQDMKICPVDLSRHAWKRKSGKKIIYAPHHSISDKKEQSISTFLEFGEKIKDLACYFKDTISWSFKPHPILRSKLYQHPDWGREKTDKYYEFWIESEFSQYDDGEYDDLFVQSDAIIHDSSSFLVEYAFTGKPRLFLAIGNSSGLVNEFGKEFLEEYEKASDIESIKSFIERVSKEDISCSARNNYVKEYLESFYTEKNPSDRILDILRAGIASGK